MLFLRMMQGNLELWQWIMLLLILLPATIVDIKLKRINVYLCLVAMLAVLAFRTLVIEEKDVVIIADLIPGVVMLFISFLSGEKIGYGDGIMLTYIGCVMGWKGALTALFVSLFASAVISVILLLLKKADRKTEIPFVPFISIGAIAGGIL